jgi:integrase/recombinase XerD
MQQFTSYLFSRGFSAATITLYTRSLADFRRWCADHGIDPEYATYNELLGYMQHLQSRRLKARTIGFSLGHLSHYFQWLREDGLRTDNPVKGIKIQGIVRQQLYHIIPMQELERIYEELKGNDTYLSGTYRLWHEQNHHSQVMHRVMFGLMIWQGLGASELERLTVSDLKLREGKIYIAGDLRSNERTLKLEAVQILDLSEYLGVTRTYYLHELKKTGRPYVEPLSVFINKRGGRGINNRLVKLLKVLGSINPLITKVQQIRSSVITHWLKNHNLRQVQYMAGHRYVSSTEKFLINDLEDLQADIDKFHPLG